METNQYFQHLKSLLATAIILVCFYTFPIKELSGTHKPVTEQDSVYSNLIYTGLENIPSTAWTKSVLFNSSGTKLYTFNLEEMSINEFDCSSKTITKKFKFKPTVATGWDYDLNKPMPSFEEKPVEGCFSHDDKILWVSLHNAGGIVAIPMDSITALNKAVTGYPQKTIFTFNVEKQRADSVSVPFIKTGKTPKVIAVTADNKFLLVSNWHSNSVSVISINDTLPPYGKKIRDIKTGVLPRGIAVSEGRYPKTYVANMGSNLISLINNKSWKVEKNIHTGYNPRHIVSAEGRVYVSYNTSSEIACINNLDNRTLFKSSTSANPRTIAITKNQRFLFVACYEGNSIDVFRINENSFSRIYSVKCNGKPVGIDLLEDSEKLEAWVCTYEGNTLQVFSFKKR